MRRTTIVVGVVVAVIIAAAWFRIHWVYKYGSQADGPYALPVASQLDPRNGTYSIDGGPVTLTNGYDEQAVVSGAASKKITRYFGNDVQADLNGDGVGDTAFLLERDTGGSGTFYYVAAQVSRGDVFIGTNALLIGDRIAPQTTEYRDGTIIVNYADRRPGEPFTAAPSVGVSRYYKVVEGELREVTPGMSEAEARVIAEKSCIKGGGALEAGSYNEVTKTWWFNANLNAVRAGCNPACVVDEATMKAEINWRCTGLILPE